MRKVILMLLLSVVSSSAMAGWVKVVESDSDIFYADPATIRKTGDIAEMWTLQDFRKAEQIPMGGMYKSIKGHDAFNCKERLYQSAHSTAYSENMGGGKVVVADDNSKGWLSGFFPANPDTVMGGLWKFACWDSALTGWVRVGEDESGTMIYYADPATIRVEGNKIKMWSLFDYKTAQREAGLGMFMSIKGQDEFDCMEDKLRILAIYEYSGSMGGGEVILSKTEIQKWEPLPPGSIGQSQLNAACGKQ